MLDAEMLDAQMLVSYNRRTLAQMLPYIVPLQLLLTAVPGAAVCAW
jgi:hypothetical protein